MHYADIAYGLTLRRRFRNETDVALNAGGGVGLRLVRTLFFDLDTRYYLLMDSGRNVGRFGTGLSYRF